MRRSVIFAVRAAAAITAALGIWWICVLPFRAAGAELDVLQRSERANVVGDAPRSAMLARDNIVVLDAIAAPRRLAPGWYILYAANCELLERWESAIDTYTRALRIDQRPELYFNRGLDRLRIGQTEAAVADFVMAARFQPAVLEHIDGELRDRVAAAAGGH